MRYLSFVDNAGVLAVLTLACVSGIAAGSESFDVPFEYFDFEKSMDVTAYGVPEVDAAHTYSEMPVAYQLARPDYQIHVQVEPDQYNPSVMVFAQDPVGENLTVRVDFIRCFLSEQPTIPELLEMKAVPPTAVRVVWFGSARQLAECKALDPLDASERVMTVHVTDPADDRLVAREELHFDVSTNGSVTIHEAY